MCSCGVVGNIWRSHRHAQSSILCRSVVIFCQFFQEHKFIYIIFFSTFIISSTDPWRNGSASDSSSEGCKFESCWVHVLFFLLSALLSAAKSLFLLLSSLLSVVPCSMIALCFLFWTRCTVSSHALQQGYKLNAISFHTSNFEMVSCNKTSSRATYGHE